MAYIYKITNDINQKIYIGKTIRPIDQRWAEHCRDYKKERCEKRPLYEAIKKYGIEHFYIEEVEQCLVEELSEREIYWIEYYDSFYNGYNATRGGDGSIYLNYKEIINIYKETQNIQEVCRRVNCDKESVRNILNEYKITIKPQQEINKEKFGKTIQQYDLEGNLINTFNTIHEAAKFINKPVSHISQCANGKRKTAYSFIWKFVK